MKRKYSTFLFAIMSKWHFLEKMASHPDVPAEDEWTVNHQIVVPRDYRPEILNLNFALKGSHF